MDQIRARLNPEILEELERAIGTSDKTQVAARLNKSVSTISNWRKGITAPSLTDLVKLQLMTGKSYDSMIICTPVAA